jgi:hypothetical protein
MAQNVERDFTVFPLVAVPYRYPRLGETILWQNEQLKLQEKLNLSFSLAVVGNELTTPVL